jgi:hypothetical protein
MFPMVTTVTELLGAHDVLREAAVQLACAKGYASASWSECPLPRESRKSPAPPGMMGEILAAAMLLGPHRSDRPIG